MDDFLDLREDMRELEKSKFIKLYLLLAFINSVVLIFNYNFEITQFKHTFLIVIGNGLISYKLLKIVRSNGVDDNEYKVFSINGGIALFFFIYFFLIDALSNAIYLHGFKAGIVYILYLGIIQFIGMFSIFCIYDNDGKLHRVFLHIFKIIVKEWKCICMCILLYALWRIGMLFFMQKPMEVYLKGLSFKEIVTIDASESIFSPVIKQFFIFHIIDLFVGTFLQIRMYLYFVFIYERNQ